MIDGAIYEIDSNDLANPTYEKFGFLYKFMKRNEIQKINS